MDVRKRLNLIGGCKEKVIISLVAVPVVSSPPSYPERSTDSWLRLCCGALAFGAVTAAAAAAAAEDVTKDCAYQ